jgi:hypothetical protein
MQALIIQYRKTKTEMCGVGWGGGKHLIIQYTPTLYQEIIDFNNYKTLNHQFLKFQPSYCIGRIL